MRDSYIVSNEYDSGLVEEDSKDSLSSFLNDTKKIASDILIDATLFFVDELLKINNKFCDNVSFSNSENFPNEVFTFCGEYDLSGEDIDRIISLVGNKENASPLVHLLKQFKIRSATINPSNKFN